MAEPIHRYLLEGVDGAPDVEITWTQEDQVKALAEGWYLDEEDGAFQVDPEGPTAGQSADACALRLWADATLGSELHLRAAILNAWACVGDWERSYREATKQMGDWHVS